MGEINAYVTSRKTSVMERALGFILKMFRIFASLLLVRILAYEISLFWQMCEALIVVVCGRRNMGVVMENSDTGSVMICSRHRTLSSYDTEDAYGPTSKWRGQRNHSYVRTQETRISTGM